MKEYIPIDLLVTTEKGFSSKGFNKKHENLPKVLPLDDGRYYILDGKHRIAKQIKKGEKEVLVEKLEGPNFLGLKNNKTKFHKIIDLIKNLNIVFTE